jgi:hypothetical protein
MNVTINHQDRSLKLSPSVSHFKAGHIGGDSIVQDQVIHGYKLPSEQLHTLVCSCSTKEGSYTVQLSSTIPTYLKMAYESVVDKEN